MKTKNLALIAVALVVLIACIAVPVSAATFATFDYSPGGYLYSTSVANYPYSEVAGIHYPNASQKAYAIPIYFGETLTITYNYVDNSTQQVIYFYTSTSSGTESRDAALAYPMEIRYNQYGVAGIQTGSAGLNPYTLVSGTSTSAYYIYTAGNSGPGYVWYYNGTTTRPTIADFSATPSSGMVPLSVVFNDTSTGNLPMRSWLWNFGDGYTAATKNTTHVYTAVGNYSVSLAIKDAKNITAATSKTIAVSAPSNYWIPVMVSDALTGNLIPNASLSSEEYGTSAAHNWTGSYGSFNVTGKGSAGLNPIQYGDYIYLMGSASGYSPNSIKYHVTIPGADMFVKNVPLCPLYLAPVSGESTMILDVYNNVTGAPLAGAYVTAGDESSWKTGYTDNRGVFVYSNISSSRSLTVTATASGYQTGTLTYYAPTGGVNYVSLGLDPGITTTNYWPVTIVDATTGYAIANSELDVKEDLSGAAWYNRTSTDGKFNVTGVGANATTPIIDNMDVYLYGQASGYTPYGYIIMMSSDNNKVLQQVALAPSSIIPISGQFVATYQAYDKTSTKSLSGVSISQYCSGLTKTGTTNSAGVLVTQNNTAGTCSYTAAKSGYTTVTGSFSGTSGGTPTITVPMSSTSINPTVTATTTAAPTVNPTATGAEGSQNAIDLLGGYAYTFMTLGIFSVFMWLFWSVLYNMTGGNIITKIMRRGRR